MPKRLRSLIVGVLAIGCVSAAVAWQAAPGDDPKQLLPVLRQPAPRFWKGNLHTHSYWSDGNDFPEMIADWYKSHGYHFLGLSDHNVLSDGQKWVAAGTQGAREEALKKYVARFGERWVERRQAKKEQVR